LGRGNSKADQASLVLLERDLFLDGSVMRDDLIEIEHLARRAALAGLLTVEEASEIGAALGRLRDALGTIHRALAYIRGSRPREVIVISIAEDIGLLAAIPARVDPVWLNGVLRRFRAEHDCGASCFLVQEAEAIPAALRAAVDVAGLTIIEDDSIQPGYARLAV